MEAHQVISFILCSFFIFLPQNFPLSSTSCYCRPSSHSDGVFLLVWTMNEFKLHFFIFFSQFKTLRRCGDDLVIGYIVRSSNLCSFSTLTTLGFVMSINRCDVTVNFCSIFQKKWLLSAKPSRMKSALIGDISWNDKGSLFVLSKNSASLCYSECFGRCFNTDTAHSYWHTKSWYYRRCQQFVFEVSVCLFVCLLAGFLKNDWSEFDEIWWVGR